MMRLNYNVFFASKEGRLDILLYLINEKGARCDDNIQDENKRTCAMLAAEGGHLEVVKYLVDEKGSRCDDNIRDYFDMTCTLLAAEGGHLEVLRYLVDGKGSKCDNSIRDDMNKTCTILAAEEGHLEVLRYLVDEKGARCDDNIRDKNWQTCTMRAAQEGHLEVLKYLVDEKKTKCDGTIVDIMGWTCSMHAARGAHLTVLKYLVDERKAICMKKESTVSITLAAGYSCNSHILRYIVCEKGIVSHKLLDFDYIDDELWDIISQRLLAEKEGEEDQHKTYTLSIIDLRCPLSKRLMTDPVVCSDGYSYQKLAIKTYIREKKRHHLTLISPMNHSRVLNPSIMTPNHHLKNLVMAFRGEAVRSVASLPIENEDGPM
jgi:hypothetical protein